MPKIEPTPGVFFNDPQFDSYFRTHEEQRWKAGDIDFSLAPSDKLTPLQVKALRGAMLVESHNPVYSSVLLDVSRNDRIMAAFAAVWTYEESKHYMVLQQYLNDSGKIDREELDREMDDTRRNGSWGEDYGQSPRLARFSYGMLQEHGTGHFYQRFGDNLDEAPLLQHILRLVAKDEYRHCQFYLMKTKQELDQDKRKMMVVDDALLTFYMPGRFIAGWSEYGDAMVEVMGGRESVYPQLVRKVGDMVGIQHLASLALDRGYRQQLQDRYGFDLAQVARGIVRSRLPFSSLPSSP